MPDIWETKLALFEDIDTAIRAAEPWHGQYKKDAVTFDKLVRIESKLNRKLKAYFKDLSTRYETYINWNEVQKQLIKAYDVFVDISDDLVDNESNIMIQIVYDILADGVVNGTKAASTLYKIPLDFTPADTVIQKTTQKYAAELVKGVSQTTKNRIKQSIDVSLQNGEDLATMKARLIDVISDPIRAEMIARTEAVNSYNMGVLEFGKQTNATSKTWQTVFGGCPLCAPLDGETVPIDEQFSDDGEDGPPLHPNCRCGMVLNYDN